MISLAWVRPPASVRYRKPEPAPVDRVTPEGLLADWPVERIAADGGRVAYVACGQVFVWEPASGGPPQRVASLSSTCDSQRESYYTGFGPYALALAGDRLAVGETGGGMSRYWKLFSENLRSRATFSLASGSATNLGPYRAVDGEAVGSGGLLVFSSWKEDHLGGRCCTIVATEQTVRRVDAGACPCPALRTEPGSLVPFDVDDGRIVAGGDNALLVLDAAGKERLTLDVRALAAALWGRGLVVLVRGELRHYDATDARLLHAWPLPDVPSERECSTPRTFRCAGIEGRLMLQDAARGLVTYVLDRRVHVIRLADGVNATIGSGTLARFMDAGIVYADGTRIHLVPFNRLPLP